IPARTDTLGLVLLEAAACGTPAVALRGTPAADLLSHYGSGVVVDDFDAGVFRDLRGPARSARVRGLRGRPKAVAAGHDVAVGTTILLNTWLDVCDEAHRQGDGSCRARTSSESEIEKSNA